MTKDEALKLALEALEVATTPLAKDRQEVLRARAAIREALAEPEIPMQNNNPGLEWDKIPKSFDDWWDSDYDPTGNPFQHETPAYWAWAGWKASSVAASDTSQYRVDETAKQRHEAQPEQEPVAYLDEGLGAFYWAKDYKKHVGFKPLYTTPPQRKPLTDEEIAKIASTPCAVVGSYVHTFARAIEAAHGIKE